MPRTISPRSLAQFIQHQQDNQPRPYRGTKFIPWLGLISVVFVFASVARASFVIDPTGGTVLYSGANGQYDDNVVSRSLDFTGTFYGTSFTSVWVSANGNLNFSGSTAYNNTPLASAPAMIAPLWDDLEVFSGSSDTITESVQSGTYYAVTWSPIETYSHSGAGEQHIQAVWFGAATNIGGFQFEPNDIAFSYAGLDAPLQGDDATIGLASGTSAYAPLPGTTDGVIHGATESLVPEANGEFLLFRPNGSDSYTVSLETTVPEPVGAAMAGVLLSLTFRRKSWR